MLEQGRVTPDSKILDVEALISDRFDPKRERETIRKGGGRKQRKYLSQKSDVKNLCVVPNPWNQF